jgi:hypothetical protein
LTLRSCDERCEKCRNECGEVQRGVLGEVGGEQGKRSPSKRKDEVSVQSRVEEFKVVGECEYDANNDEDSEIPARLDGTDNPQDYRPTYAKQRSGFELPSGNFSAKRSSLEFVEGVRAHTNGQEEGENRHPEIQRIHWSDETRAYDDK